MYIIANVKLFACYPAQIFQMISRKPCNMSSKAKAYQMRFSIDIGFSSIPEHAYFQFLKIRGVNIDYYRGRMKKEKTMLPAGEI